MNVNKSLDILWFLYKTHKLQVTSHQINSSIDFHQHVCSSCTLSGCGWYVVFMQAVVSGSSVRVVAVWRWWRAARPGPLPRLWWSCSVCSVVRQARPSAEQHGDTMQWPKHRDQGTRGPHLTSARGGDSGDMTAAPAAVWWCGPVVAGAGLLLPGPSRISFIHSSTAHTGTALTVPPCQQQQSQLSLTVTQSVLLLDIWCSVKQIPTVRTALERPPAADTVNI